MLTSADINTHCAKKKRNKNEIIMKKGRHPNTFRWQKHDKIISYLITLRTPFTLLKMPVRYITHLKTHKDLL